MKTSGYEYLCKETENGGVAVERVQRRLHRGGLPCALSEIELSRGFALTVKTPGCEYLCKATEKGEAFTGVGFPAHCPRLELCYILTRICNDGENVGLWVSIDSGLLGS